MTTIALVGNPNCGKTTLFNALTGSRQHVGNWPGVTVERKSGFFLHQQRRFEVVDLPGVYSLTVASDVAAIDESIACQFILQQQADVIVNIVDGSNLERHLYLTMQLLESGVPLVVAVNMMDVAQARGIHLQLEQLSVALGCPVVPLQANKSKGLVALQKQLLHLTVMEPVQSLPFTIPYAEPLPQVIAALAAVLRAGGGAEKKRAPFPGNGWLLAYWKRIAMPRNKFLPLCYRR